MVPSLSITDPRYLKWSTFFSSSPFNFTGNGFSLVDRCSVFATLIFRPLSVKTFCHDSSLFWVSVLVISIIARSSAYRSSHGSSFRTSWDIVSTSMMNRNGLSAEPWWRPIPTSKCSLIPRLDFTRVVAPWYISCTSLMYPSGIFCFRMHLHSTSRGTVSYTFSRSANTMSRGVLPSLYFSHRVLIINMTSVVPTPDLKPNCPSEMLTMSLGLWSIIRSHTNYYQSLFKILECSGTWFHWSSSFECS